MDQQTKIFRMDESGEWKEETLQTGDLVEFKKDQEKCQKRKDT